MTHDAMHGAEADVLVVGAGMAGLAAARALCQRGVRVLLVEAQQRVGGRVLSQTTDTGQVVELGAEFVHGRSPELWALIDESGVTAVERSGVTLHVTPEGGVTADGSPEDWFDPLEQLKRYDGPDRTFAAWLADSGLDEERAQRLTSYVEGFNAADSRRIGIRALGQQQKAEDEIDGERAWHIRGGYSQLADHLARQVSKLGGDLRVGWEVRSLRWSDRALEATSAEGTVVRAKHCIVTVPLGVLQRVNTAAGIAMQPEPAAIAHARRMEMGDVVRFTMLFRQPWWQTLAAGQEKSPHARQMRFLFTGNTLPPVWWTSYPEGEAMASLTGWVGGPRSHALQGRSAQELGDEACRTLAEALRADPEQVRAQLAGTWMHDWSADPFARGAYSYVPAGALDAPAAMAQPERHTVFFAGEHTDITAQWGTVHAALRSGQRAASQVMDELA